VILGVLDIEESGQDTYDEAGLFGLLDATSPSVVVAESFDYRAGEEGGLVLVSRNLLGVSKLWCTLHHVDYHEQSPSEGKAYFTNDALRALGLYDRGKPHTRDAMRHLLRFLTHGAGAKHLTREERHRLLTAKLVGIGKE